MSWVSSHAHPGQKWGSGADCKAEKFITWGGSLLPPIQNLEPNVRRDYLHKYYLPKLQEDRQPTEVLRRVTNAAIGNEGGRKKSGTSSRPPPTPPTLTCSSTGSPKRNASMPLPHLSRSASQPLPISTQRTPGSMAVNTDSGRYGTLWLQPRGDMMDPIASKTSFHRGAAIEEPKFQAGPKRLWGPVAHMTQGSRAGSTSGSRAGSTSGSQRGSGRIRFSESCGRTPSEAFGRTPEPSCH